MYQRQSSIRGNNPATGWLDNAPANGSNPKAYVNWILLDEQMKPVTGASGFDAVGATDELKLHAQTVNIAKNGYLYVYVSNQSDQDVFFDNLQVVHARGPLLEETHYYPFGLAMSGISSKAAGKLENRYKYNGKELQSEEFSDGSGLEVYDFGARQYDQQIGMWHTVDPMADSYQSYSPYAYVLNNPIYLIDPNGMYSTHTDSSGNVLAVYNDGDLGVYKHNDAKSKSDVDKTHTDKNTSAGGTKMGETLEMNSFAIDGDFSKGAAGKIDFKSFEARDQIMTALYKIMKLADKSAEGDVAKLLEYVMNASNNEEFDLKSKGGNDVQNIYRGSQISAGVYVSARDAGNFLAGAVARKLNIPEMATYRAMGSLQLSKNRRWLMPFNYIFDSRTQSKADSYGELPISHTFQQRGYNFNIKR